MIKKFYSMFDSTAQIFLNPLEAKNHGDAIRLFTTFVNGDKEQSNIARYPTHYTLFHLYDMDDQTGMTGTYDDTKQELGKQQPPKELIIGASCVEAENRKFTIKELVNMIEQEQSQQNVHQLSAGTKQ